MDKIEHYSFIMEMSSLISLLKEKKKVCQNLPWGTGILRPYSIIIIIFVKAKDLADFQNKNRSVKVVLNERTSYSEKNFYSVTSPKNIV